jgi:hypothetical protein
LDVDELRKLLIVPKPPKSKRAKTRIGQAIEANEREIRLAVAGLLLQIEAKIEALRHARLNSPESQEELTDLELMKSKLDRILVMLDTFAKDKTAEKETVKSVTTFRDDVKELWKKHQDQIVTTTFKASVFVAAVGVLSAFKADSAAAIATAGYIIGGKSPKDALKKAKKKISDWAG